jgi:hypothetical protein
MSLCNFLHGIKVLMGYSDNVSGMVNMKTLKVRFMKSHDYQILIGQFLPIAIRGILPVKVWDTIMKLCSFFNAISQKVVDPMKLTKLQDDLILMMCNLETIFPSSFSNLMPHLLVHIVHKINTWVLCFFIRCIHLKCLWLFQKTMFVIEVARMVACPSLGNRESYWVRYWLYRSPSNW